MDQLSWTAHRDMQSELALELDAITGRFGLGPALRTLQHHQVHSGFIRDTLDEVERFVFTAPDAPHRYFSAQYNPARSRRFAGAGRTLPPDGVQPVHGGCFLCSENIWWQQQGAEMGYDLPQAEGRYTAWMNPFPLVPGHAILATRDHQPQGWDNNGDHLLRLADDLLNLADLLPGWIGFYNGVGAGASVTAHLHYQFLPRPPHYGLLPLELARSRCPGDGLISAHYPLCFMHWCGELDSVRARMGHWLRDWLDGPGKRPDSTANLVAIRASDREGIDAYFIPRDSARTRAKEFHGLVGGFEILGEIICSSVDERERLAKGELGYREIARLLSHVSVAL